MDAKNDHELFVRRLKSHIETEAEIVREYRALSRLVESIPVRLLLDWLIAEKEAHHKLLRNMIEALKQRPQKHSRNGPESLGSEHDKVLFYTDRLRLFEEKFAADGLYLKSQACWEGGELFDALLDALMMDSKKHQRVLSAVEKMLKV